MANELVLTPEELYYLGKCMKAKYIDYAYIAAMKDIGSNAALFEHETKASLVKKGVISEDFSGNTLIENYALDILRPVFFGERENSVELLQTGEQKCIKILRFHYLDNSITVIQNDGELFLVKNVDLIWLDSYIQSLIPDKYACKKNEIIKEINQNDISGYLVLKSNTVGKQAKVRLLVKTDYSYCHNNNGLLEMLDQASLMSVIKSVIWEE